MVGSWSWQIVFQGKVELVGRKASGRYISGIAIHTWRKTGVFSDWELVFFFQKWFLLNTRGVSALALTESWLRIFLSSGAAMICSTGLVISKEFIFS